MPGISKDFHLTTPQNEQFLIAELTTGPNAEQNLIDVKARLAELNDIPEERCSISSDQRRFLTRVMAAVEAWQAEQQASQQ